MSPELFALCLQQCDLKPGERVLAAVSGGADSMCLLDLLSRIRESYPIDVFCAHAEHGLRGNESLADELFVRQACKDRNIPFISKHIDVLSFAKEKKIGIEEAARELRYAFLRNTALELCCTAIATAHHNKDQAETLLLRLARGTDLRGLSGMQFRTGDLIRPFLDTNPQELKEYLLLEHIPWREDASNADLRYARNRIRRMVLPELTEIQPNADRAIARFARVASRDEDYFSQELKKFGIDSPVLLIDGAAVPRDVFVGLHLSLSSRAIRNLLEAAGFAIDERIIRETAVAAHMKGKRLILNLPGNGRLTIGKRIIAAVCPKRVVSDVALYPGKNETPFGVFFLSPSADQTGDGKFFQRIPKETIPFLTVGEYRREETMIPFGRHTPTLLGKLIKDARIEAPLRRSIPILRYANTPLWIVGIRAAEACRCSGKEDWLLEWRTPVAELAGFASCI